MIDQVKQIVRANVLLFGDMMVDKYINGKVDRISPEAPVPVLKVTSKHSKLGGAGNVIDNIISLGANVRAVGYFGNDSDGCWAINTLKDKGIDTEFIKKYNNITTITKTRLVSKNQQFLRCDEEVVVDAPKEFVEFVKENINGLLNGINIVVISDYAKGAVTKELAQFIINAANDRNIPSIVDPKGKDYSKYTNATACTPNVSELSVIAGYDISDEGMLFRAGKEVKNLYNIKNLVLTRSEKGITLFSEDLHAKNFPAISKDVVDVSGAGDTVVATIACLMSSGVELEDCCVLANLAASVVCSKFGTATLSLNELMEQVVSSGQFKYIPLQNAKYIIASLKEKGKKIVFTNGCFDMLHAGHLSSFLQAKAYGDVLIVAVNSDASIKRIKGQDRPIIEEKYRIEMLCALECIDYVILMEDDNPINIIKELEPDVTVKGSDWKDKVLPEKSVVEAYGGEVKFIDLKGTLSTTNIIRKIRNE